MTAHHAHQLVCGHPTLGGWDANPIVGHCIAPTLATTPASTPATSATPSATPGSRLASIALIVSGNLGLMERYPAQTKVSGHQNKHQTQNHQGERQCPPTHVQLASCPAHTVSKYQTCCRVTGIDYK